jgi:predicted RNA-binding Zn-ribbon protein involved in translation (DUF1610 family)
MKDRKLGDVETSELLIRDLYIDLRKKVHEWAEITSQTAQARMGYVGQHLVSVVTGYPGAKSGARGKDLVLPDDKFAEIKTCYRVDQLGTCSSCGTVVASIDKNCPSCGSVDINRKHDSKWLIAIHNNDEFANILDPEFYFLVLFDFPNLANPDVIRASIWRVRPDAPGFAYCMIDYYLNIRSKSDSKAPFDFWPFSLKFCLMKPLLIYRSLITADDLIETQLFPNRDDPLTHNITPLTRHASSSNLTKENILHLANFLDISVNRSQTKAHLLLYIDQHISQRHISEDNLSDLISREFYHSKIEQHIPNLPSKLKEKLIAINQKVETLINSLQ